MKEQYHHTTLELSIGAFQHNLEILRAKLHEDTKVMLMVKAHAYGAGMKLLKVFLSRVAVDYLAVTFIDEGIAVRKAGIDHPIMVLNPHVDNLDLVHQYKLEPSLGSFELLEAYLDLIEKDLSVPFHLKIDSGMHRLGFEMTDLEGVNRKLLQHNGWDLRSVYSHLSASDNPVFDAFSLEQTEVFQKCYDLLCEGLGVQPMRHLLNSGGVLRFPQFQYDLVRIGIGWYGGYKDPDNHYGFKTVFELKTTIAQVRIVNAGETVSYQRSGKIDTTKKIAVMNIGYADGFMRKLGNGNYHVNVKGQMVPTIGNVCMDMSIIDVTSVPDVKIGDTVTVIGQQPSLFDMATKLDTISYEVLTGIDRRVRRVIKD